MLGVGALVRSNKRSWVGALVRSNKRLSDWYFLLLRYTCSIKEKEHNKFKSNVDIK
jgi:hypothetical protein